MKKFKILLAGVLAVLLIGSLTGCEFLAALLEGSDSTEYPKTKTVPVKDSGDVYLIKYNPGTEKIAYGQTGYVTDDPESRFAGEDLIPVTGSKPAIVPEGQNYDSFIDQLNNEATKSLQNSFARTGEEEKKQYKLNDPETPVKKDDTRDFKYIIGTSNNKNVFSTQTFTCMYAGTNCNVWYYDDISTKKNGIDISASDISFETLAQKFDSIYSNEESIVGSHIYTESPYGNLINPTTKINIIVADLFGDAKENLNGGTYGYFSRSDLVKDKEDGNNAMVIYLDTYFYTKDANSIYSTIVHEYNHLLNFVNKTIKQGVVFNTWYTEMLSMVCEDLFANSILGSSEVTKSGPISRLPYYFTENYNVGFTTWFSGNNVYYSYANAYAFGAYLVRNYGGVTLLKKLATNGYGDIAAIEAATGKKLSELMKNYSDVILYPTETSRNYSDVILYPTETSRSYYNLNHKITYDTEPSLFFPAINLCELQYASLEECTASEYNKTKSEERTTQDGKYYRKVYTNAAPVIYLAGNYQPANAAFIGSDDITSDNVAVAKYYTVDLYPKGITVHYVGRLINRFDLTYYESTGIQYYTDVK